MNSIQSYTDYSDLLKIINNSYPVDIDQIDLHREMIGYVYFAKSHSKKYVLKLYRCFDADNALRSIHIIQYLKNNDYPVVSIVPTGLDGTHITINTPQGLSIAVLFDYVEGATPNLETDIVNMGQQVGRLHRIMKEYPEPLISRGKDFYIDRYIAILRELEYGASRIDEIEAYGSTLWNNMERLANGFCHGDLHTGNMLQTEQNQYVLFDFDVASRTYSVIDVATLCNASNFNQFNESSYDRTIRAFERFYRGYSKECVMNDVEIAAIFDFIPVRHYEIIATITKCQGLQCLSTAFLDEQYEWFMKWKDLCDRKG